MKGLIKALKIYGNVVKLSLGGIFAYRASYLLSFFTSLIWVVSMFVFFEGIYGSVDSIAGYEKIDMVLLLGINQIFMMFFSMFISPGNSLDWFIRTYTLDNYLMKPVNQMVYSTLNNVKPVSILEVGTIVGLMVYVFSQKTYDVTVVGVLLFVVTFVLGCVSLYLIQLLLQLLSFWILDSGLQYFLSDLWNVMRVPSEVLGRGWVGFILTYVLPMLLIMNIPFHALIGDLNWIWVVVLAGNCVVMFLLAQFLWDRGVRKYCNIE